MKRFFLSGTGCMDEKLLEKLTLEPAIELLIGLDLTFPAIDTYPTPQQLDPNFVLKYAHYIKD